MIVYHGTQKADAEKFLREGFNPSELVKRKIFGPQQGQPGLFVTTDMETAKQFGRSVVAIEVDIEDLEVPPNLANAGATLQMALDNPFEPQAFIRKLIPPARFTLAFHEEPKTFWPPSNKA